MTATWVCLPNFLSFSCCYCKPIAPISQSNSLDLLITKLFHHSDPHSIFSFSGLRQISANSSTVPRFTPFAGVRPSQIPFATLPLPKKCCTAVAITPSSCTTMHLKSRRTLKRFAMSTKNVARRNDRTWHLNPLGTG